MTLTNLLKLRTFETKAFLATSITSVVGTLVDNNPNLLLLAPLAALPLYLSLRVIGFSEYIANIRFDNWRPPMSREELEKKSKEPAEKGTSKMPENFYIDRAKILYNL